MENTIIRKHWSLYSKYIPDLKVRGIEWRGACPFHKEKTVGAFAINGETGQYYCHSCGAQGNAVTFAKQFNEVPEQYYQNFNHKVGFVDHDRVKQYNNSFKNNLDQVPSYWDQELIDALDIGYDEKLDKLVFPIYNDSGHIINLKWHKGRQTVGSKVSLYPLKFIEKFHNDYIVICEGEKDTITLLSNKIQAITGTGGANNIPKDLSSLDKFINIYICFDNDVSGNAGAEKWAQSIKKLQAPKLIKIADIGRFVKERGDVTDYFNSPFCNRDSFCREVLDRSKYYKPFTDIPDFIRRVMLSDKYQALTMRDQNVFTTIVLRASRYYVKTTKVKGKNIQIGPGEYFTRITSLKRICASDISEKQVRSGIESLVAKGFIKSEDLKAQRGRLITILDWNEDGQQNGQNKNRFNFVKKYPFLRGGTNDY